ncbi:MAG TPA: ABC transporter ATP-binding protein [Candidatus Paceibacterota bacterium]
MSLIELKEVSKIYLDELQDGGATGPATSALSRATFSVDQGEYVSIMGPSGSGKSTLLHILGFLDRPSSGKYTFAGKTMDELTDVELARVRNEKMGFVFQAFNLLARTSVLENVILPLGYSNVPELRWRALGEEAVAAVGLSHRLFHEPSELSGGEKQRVAIARSLVNNPDVIFADEPTGNLDSKSGANVMEIFDTLNKQGKTVIAITHDEKVAEHARRTIKLRDGKIESDTKVKK